MSGEHEAAPSGWTTDTLKEYLEVADRQIYAYFERILMEHATAHKAEHVATDLTVQTAFQASEKAIMKSDESTADKFHSVNEFRAQLADQASTLLTRDEAYARFTSSDVRLNAIDAKLRDLELTAKGHLTVTAFERYLERNETDRSQERRFRTSLAVGVALSVLGSLVGVVLALTGG